MRIIQAQDRGQVVLFNRLDDLVSAKNPVRLIDIIVEKICLENPEQMQWKGSAVGRPSYSIQTMLKLLLYSYLNRIRGSRKIEEETYRNVELMWLLGNLKPDHWCICEFRRENEENIRFVTLAFRQFLKAHGYIGGTTIGFDGSKMKAYAKREMMSLKKMQKRLVHLEEQLEEYLKEADLIDERQDKEEELADENDQLQKKADDLQEEVDMLKRQIAQLQSNDKSYAAENDPDAQLMKARDGKMAAYNVQAGIDEKYRMIVLAEVHTDATDIDLLKVNMEDLEDQLAIVPEEIIADKGYGNLDQIQKIEQPGKTHCMIPVHEQASKKKDAENGISFTYDRENDQFICHHDKPLRLLTSNQEHGNQVRSKYRGIACDGCPQRTECTTSPYGRTVTRNINQDWIDSYKQRLETPENQEKIKKRKGLVEHPFGTIKTMMGKHGFLLTKLPKAQIEIDILATVYNIRRLLNIDPIEMLMSKAVIHQWKMA